MAQELCALFERRLLELSPFREVPAGARRYFHTLERALYDSSSPRTVAGDVTEVSCRRQEDPLSAEYRRRRDVRPPDSARTRAEQECCARHFAQGPLQNIDFLELMVSINADFHDNGGHVRQRPVQTMTDRFGGVVVFPNTAAVPFQMQCIARFISAEFRDAPLYTAVVAMAAILNLHPFEDGNGRSSRVIFNLSLWHAFGRRPYIALFEHMQASGGDFELALRRAEVLGDWRRLYRFLGRSSRPSVMISPRNSAGHAALRPGMV
jgi:hypothetical protein